MRSGFPSIVGFICALCAGFYIANFPADKDGRTPAAVGMENFGQRDNVVVQEIGQWMQWIPKDVREPWLNYIGSMSNISHGANESLEGDNFKLTAQPCFSDLAAKFYAWLLHEDVKQFKKITDLSSKRVLKQAYALSDEAGSGDFADINPGAVWDKALEIAGGNGNVAISLIGLCGHDDMIQIKPKLLSDRSATAAYEQTTGRELDDLRSFLLDKVKTARDTKSAHRYLDDADSIVNIKTDPEQKDRLFCLQTSILYLPKSLGKDIDLDAKLKNKITMAQAPTKGAGALPAKYYHFIGSAMTACKLKSQTLTGFLSIFSNPMAARLYRAKMLAGKVEAIPPWEGINPDDITESDLADVISRYKAIPQKWTADLFPTPELGEFLRDPRNKIFRLIGLSNDVLATTPTSEILKSVQSKFADYDAAALARKWYRKISLPGVGTAYLPSDMKRPENQTIFVGEGGPPINWGTQVADKCDEPKWSVARCARALAKLNSWEVDFDWSQDQHYRGAKFAMQQCLTLPSGDSVETLACRALEKQKPETDSSATAK